MILNATQQALPPVVLAGARADLVKGRTVPPAMLRLAVEHKCGECGRPSLFTGPVVEQWKSIAAETGRGLLLLCNVCFNRSMLN